MTATDAPAIESPMTGTALEIQSANESALTKETIAERAEKAFNDSFPHREQKSAANGAAKPASSAAPVDPLAEETKGMSEKAVTKWKKIHERATAAEKERDSFKSELAKLRTGTPNGNIAEYEKLKSEHGEFDRLLKQTALEKHPQFRNAYDGEIARQTAAAKAIVGEKFGDKIAAVLESGDDKAWEEITAEIGSLKASQLAVAGAAIQKLKADKNAELENWKVNSTKLEQFEAQKQATAKEAREQEVSRAVDQAITNAQSKPGIFRPRDNDDAWNAEVDTRLQQVREWATADLSPPDRANLAMRAASADAYLQLLTTAVKFVNQQQKQLAKYRSAQPTVGGSVEPANQGSIPADMGYIEAATRRLVDMGELRTS